MANWIARYTNWLHTRWPAGTVEKLPETGEDGSTSVPGLRIVGDLTGIPLLKFSVHTGARAVRAFLAEGTFAPSGPEPRDGVVDLAIVGGGVSGISAALEAQRAGLSYRLFESAQPFSTIVNFPKGKPIYTYPTEMEPDGHLTVSAEVKEALLEELESQRREAGIETTTAHVERVEKNGDLFTLHLGGSERATSRRVIIAIGRTGNYRKLGVAGEELDKVYNRLYDPREFAGRKVLVVGGGDSALETTIALVCGGAHVTHSYRKAEFSRPKPDNEEKIRRLQDDPTCAVQVTTPASERVNTATGPFLHDADHAPSSEGMSARARDGGRASAAAGSLVLRMGSQLQEIREDQVLLKTSNGSTETLENDVVFAMIGREAPLDFFRRSGIALRGELRPRDWTLLSAFVLLVFVIYLWKGWLLGHTDLFAVGKSWGLDRSTMLGAFTNASATPSFWFTSAYTACIVGFGVARIRRRRTPYVTRQTIALMAVQVIPLFILPEILLPWMDANGWLPATIRDHLFPNGQYWRALGFILAWPLFLPNLMMPQPMSWWIVIGSVQSFVLIPLLVWRWGKGAYCGWICSCGALAETMGDTHRQKMWHGPLANRFNMTGQVILVLAVILTGLFALGWIPGAHGILGHGLEIGEKAYKIIVDIVIGGAIGLGFYFWFSGRVWCRFACPLAALMHIYARFSRFRIFADKKKCISCNVCTSVCHQGIDIMNFANKGLPMADPECVRCSACVQSCPTGVLQFGRLNGAGEPVYDRLAASPVLMREQVVASIRNDVGRSPAAGGPAR
ncbi:MAG: NAD(P)-binding domain-containing protein [Candidatus Eisenbacteria bacterium]|uniref:NAD(P)-binding domain-containing protein n=1 Tax=Eiseniibacteriota bacterium TaxID=2212470 RepID=A0A956LZ96_UNCEI|nr:NAD(P)-binding domain-containing protein [Candidatus Eisenbacteria bacterium]